jgi:diguanylate cyclase (GGDEF)-like protein
MRVYRSNHLARMLTVLAATVLVVAAASYALGTLEDWRRTLLVAFAAGTLLALFLVLVRVFRKSAQPSRQRPLYDSLTGLPNRTWFADRAESALARSVKESRPVAVLIVDLDGFEEVNHGLGHDAGDQLLAVVGQRLAALAPPGSSAARLCGDEFAVLLEDLPDVESAIFATQRIERSLKVPVELNGSEVLISASVGIALASPEQECGAEDLLRMADVAMHAAKRDGKARHKVFDPDASTTTSGRSLVEAELRRALEEGEFLVHYQPLIVLETGEVCGFEALVRWRHPVYGLVPPDEFVPLAEQIGLIVPIGRWVLQEACRRMRLWQEEHPSAPPLTLSVNVSARQFRQPNLAEEISRVLEKNALDPRLLQLEITEGVMVHFASAEAALRKLKASGVRLAMDDFGTGYSNLSYVKRLPVNTLKIDRSYVDGLGRNAEDTAIVHATVAFAKALGLSLTAEGIEDAEQLRQLRELGCESGQGYHFAKPLPDAEVSSFLAAHLHRSTQTGSESNLHPRTDQRVKPPLER